MNAEDTPYTARADFPVKRMLRLLVLGNMMTTGGVYLLAVGGSICQYIISYIKVKNSLPSVDLIAKSANGVSSRLIDLIIKYPGIVFVLFALGGLAAMTWYVVARRIETREMKKRWLVIQKSQTVDTN